MINTESKFLLTCGVLRTISFPDSTAGLERKGSECPRSHLSSLATAALAGIEQESIPGPSLLWSFQLPFSQVLGGYRAEGSTPLERSLSQRHLRLQEVVEIRTAAV